MAVTTYTRDGITDIRQLIRYLVKDLTGTGTPEFGSAAAHMRVVYPEGFDVDAPFDPNTLDEMVILEANSNIDPFADDTGSGDPQYDPWRICFHTSQWTGRKVATKKVEPGNTSWVIDDDPIKTNSLAIYVGTPSTLAIDPATTTPAIGWITTRNWKGPSYNGFAYGEYTTWTYKETYIPKDLVEPVGNTGAEWTNTFDPQDKGKKFKPAPSPAHIGFSYPATYQSPEAWDGPDVTNPDQLFINRYINQALDADFGGTGFRANPVYANPTSYQITVSDHGLFIGCWGPDPEENGKDFSWLLIQRPVDKKTGVVRGLPIDPLKPGNRPLFCVNSVNGKFWKFVVREHDNAVPSKRKDATVNAADSGAIINPYQQQSLTENGEYVITFLNNLNSSRFKYADELDMLGTVSSDVVGGGADIEVTVYSETAPRMYHALWSSGSFGTKMRIMVVKDIPAPNPY